VLGGGHGDDGGICSGNLGKGFHVHRFIIYKHLDALKPYGTIERRCILSLTDSKYPKDSAVITILIMRNECDLS